MQPLVVEHLEDNFDELLLHLLKADLRRFAIDAFISDQSDVLRRLLVFIDRALADGDEHVNNAMAVFVEDAGWWDPAMASFIATWPPAMQTEARRQQGSQSSSGRPQLGVNDPVSGR